MIVHRDLKPSNVLIGAAGRPCVTDCGLAKILEADGRMTRTGAIAGTPGYMAPEQAAGRAGEVGPRSDLYSLGAILFELLTGRPPFSGETPLDTLVRVLEGEPPSPRRLRPEVPRALERICLRFFERNPADRYRSAGALAEDLDRLLRGEQVEPLAPAAPAIRSSVSGRSASITSTGRSRETVPIEPGMADRGLRIGTNPALGNPQWPIRHARRRPRRWPPAPPDRPAWSSHPEPGSRTTPTRLRRLAFARPAYYPAPPGAIEPSCAPLAGRPAHAD